MPKNTASTSFPPPTPFEVWFIKEYQFQGVHIALTQLLQKTFDAGREYERTHAKTTDAPTGLS